jgi:hypothetical protein
MLVSQIWSGFPRKFCTSAHDSGQVLTFRGIYHVPVPPCVQARERLKSEHAENGRWRMSSGPLPEFVHAVHLTPGTLLFRG